MSVLLFLLSMGSFFAGGYVLFQYAMSAAGNALGGIAGIGDLALACSLLIIAAVCLSGSAIREGLDKANKEHEQTREAIEALARATRTKEDEE